MNPDAILEKVKEVIIEQLSVEDDAIKLETSFIDDLGADSLDIVEIIYGLEEAFAVVGIDELADYGLSYPFNLCMNLAFNGNDPDLTNNSKCLTYDKPNGLQENANYSVNVYPNPANNVVTIANAAGAQIDIYNLAGQQVASVASASANQVISVANLAEGLYVIRVANGNQVSTSKLSVVR